ncbi:50S ribosomal protein L4 [Phosphitispora fastidiosa]|uniref:50S ribosomal protein L4 n=1 Tax=Phosphitispora fastidiosa TaxID=2837202 RepID=UPI001E5A8E13|nr:50S ribosomal protein L4 [Phosphitispora fastidiosa]MBU7007462.1 large subunit ribosomal protein L4 [Phosphitispora fastidiosa]
MPKVALYNSKGEQVGEVELKEEVFGVEVNEAILHDVVVNHLANRRQGNSSAKTRSEVSGGGRKPFRQKGTGRARAGTIRSPLWRKGGIVFPPKPRSYKYSLPKKVRRLALKSALSSKVLDGNIIVLEGLQIAEPKTKEIVGLLANLKVDSKALVVTAEADTAVVKSARNMPRVTPTHANSLNVYDVLNHEKLIITRDAVTKVEEVLA